jgi:serine/threonine-protein kinase
MSADLQERYQSAGDMLADLEDFRADADSTAKVGTTIKLTVSTGPETNTMPDLVNKSEASAKSYLDKMAIQVVVSVSYEQNDDYTDGYVIRTDPEANASLTAGQTVTLFVCQKSDEEMVPVPALVGMDVDDALALIDSSNLGRGDVRSIESDLPEGTVTFQSIDEGEKVKSGTTINLQVSKGPEESGRAGRQVSDRQLDRPGRGHADAADPGPTRRTRAF